MNLAFICDIPEILNSVYRNAEIFEEKEVLLSQDFSDDTYYVVTSTGVGNTFRFDWTQLLFCLSY